MTNKYYVNDPGIDHTDAATDDYLLGEALRGDGDAFAGYYGPVEVGDSWTRHPLSPGITELKIEQRRHRIFLLVCHFRPRTRAEADARAEAIERYCERTGYWARSGGDTDRTRITVAQKKREHAR